MVTTTPAVMKRRGQIIDKRIGNSAHYKPADSDEEFDMPKAPKGKRGSANLSAKGRKALEEKPVPNWLVYLLLFVVVGGSVVQIFNNIWTQPSMSDTH